MKPGTIIYRGKAKTGLPIVVRYPTIKDVEIMRRFINTLSKERTFIIFQDEQMSYKAEKQYVEKSVSQIKKNHALILLAFSGKTLVGSSDIALEEGAMEHVGRFGIAIAKKFRGQGIGTLLTKLAFVEGKKRLKKLKIIRLGVFSNNPRAIRLYKKMGFKRYGVIPKGLYHRGKYIDDIYMYRAV